MDNYRETLKEAIVQLDRAKAEVRKAKFKNGLNEALTKVRLLSPSVRRRIVDNMDLGYLLQSQVTVTEQDWSAHADGTDTERQTLKDIGNKFYPLYENL